MAYFFYPFAFNLPILLNEKGFSFKQYKIRTYIFIYSDNLSFS